MRDIIDLETYPLDQPDSTGWHHLVAQCRNDLAATGMFNLPGLMRQNAAAKAVGQMQGQFAENAFSHTRSHNIYFKKDIPGLAPDHPALRLCETSNKTLCADQIATSDLLRLYEWPEFAVFLAATMQKPALFVMRDPLARVNVMSYQAGQALNWHFDRSEFTTTLLLQAPQRGGEFEYRTDLRSDDDPNYDGVAKLLNGKDDRIKKIALTPGTLNVFRGKNTAHRVTPVEGDNARIIAVFSYYDRHGVTFSQEERVGFYGRAS
jgi:hypothetical protein